MYKGNRAIIWIIICSSILMIVQGILWGNRLAIAAVRRTTGAAISGSQAEPARMSTPELFAVNLSAPFCYKEGGTREWSIFPEAANGPLAIQLSAKRNGAVIAQSNTGILDFDGIHVVLDKDGKLEVTSLKNVSAAAFDLEVTLDRKGGVGHNQVLSLRRAPPVRPISYIVDPIDDLIHTFDTDRDWKTGKYQFDKPAFDQYFRRMQCQGITQAVVWDAPSPLITDSSAYAPSDWNRFEKQARAILGSRVLDNALLHGGSENRIPEWEGMRAHGGSGNRIPEWEWMRAHFAFTLDSKAQANFVESARDHGISLSIGLRPFESAVTKYYEVPVFGMNGQFLWNFLPLASPPVNYHASEVGYAQYREILKRMGLDEYGKIGTIEIQRPRNVTSFMKRFRSKHDNLRIVLSEYPPFQSNSFILQRQQDKTFKVRRFKEIEVLANARRQVVKEFQVRYDRDKGIVISGLDIPTRYRYILLDNPSGRDGLEFDANAIKMWSRRGTPLGRTDIYWAFDESSPEREATLVAGIPNNLGYHPVYFASESSAEYVHRLKHLPHMDRSSALVINRGDAYSAEMIDFNQPAARAMIVSQLRSILRHPAFEGGIFINPRSHTQLAGNMADGADGIRSEAYYKSKSAYYHHLGVDLGYAPRQAALNPELRRLASSRSTISQITTWQTGEWEGSTEGELGNSSDAVTDDQQPRRYLCNSNDCKFPWLHARNVEVAGGLRLLLQDLISAFPEVRIRVVIPEREPVIKAVSNAMSKMDPGTVSYTHGRNDWIRNVGEGLTMLDLKGTSVEPVLLGTGPDVDMRVLDVYLKNAIDDLRDNHGSSFHGPKEIIYEGQFTLNQKDGQKIYEQRICSMLSHPKDIDRVDLYESEAWLYKLPMENQDVYDFGFLDHCQQIINKRNPVSQAKHR